MAARRVGDTIEIADTKDDCANVLRFTLDEWQAFLSGATAGEFSFEDGASA